MNFKSTALVASTLVLSSNINAASVALHEIINTNASYTSGSAISDGLFDAFDGSYYLSGFTSLDVVRNVSTLEDIRTYSILDTFTNNTGSNFSGTLSYHTNLGSDGSEVAAASTDYSVITDDVSFGRDPAIAFIFGNNAYTQNNVTASRGSNRFDMSFNFELAAGETVSLLNFAALYADDTDRSIDFSQAELLANQLVLSPDYRNLTAEQINSIVNFDGAPISAVPVPAAAWLFGSGLLGLVGLARRKKRNA